MRDYSEASLNKKKHHELVSIVIAFQAQRKEYLRALRQYEKKYGFLEGGRDPLFAKTKREST